MTTLQSSWYKWKLYMLPDAKEGVRLPVLRLLSRGDNFCFSSRKFLTGDWYGNDEYN
jgi:hypothetical protein